MDIGVITDSTSDVPVEEAARLGIEVVPAIIVFRGQNLRDGVDISRSELYRRMATGETIPSTASPSTGAFEAAYESMLQRGYKTLLSIHPAATFSGIFNAARLAAARFPDRVFALESGQISLGTGFQVLGAAEAVQRGATLDQLRALVQSTRERVHLVAMIESLTHLAHSGRVSSILAGITNLLQIKLLLSIVEGTFNRVGQVRTHARGFQTLADQVAAWGPLEKIAIVHANARTAADTLTQQLHEKIQGLSAAFPKPLTVEITPAIGVHAGPGAVGVVAVSKPASG